MLYFIGRAALSWMDGTTFNGSDIIDRHAQPKVCDYLHRTRNANRYTHLGTTKML